MQVSGSTAFSEPIHQHNKHSSKYIRTGSLANLSLNQAQKVINYIKGERQMQMLRTYATAPLAPQIWGELDSLPPSLGGWGGQNDGVCVSPVLSMWIPVTSKERSHVRVTVALTLPG